MHQECWSGFSPLFSASQGVGRLDPKLGGVKREEGEVEKEEEEEG